MKEIVVIIPAYNEGQSIAAVISEIPELVSEIIVVNNNSTDNTAVAAEAAGATVLFEENMGYGFACLKGIKYLKKRSKPPAIVVFMDGDYSDYPEDLHKVVKPILDGDVDFVIGARTKALREKGSMTPQQSFGNGLATFLMRMIYRSDFTDLGPFRAIRYEQLMALEMEDKTYGWTVEMQLKVLKKGIAYTEVPVRYKKRIGISKVSGTVKGTIFAGIKILGWIFKYSLK
ncbi:glycosyltransferase family 2 protein [Muriicola soli]|uniref:Glycosyltransferase family 2 protein n=1 Tax=Muriicola soli TaxID=2507538 RepID=A0A411EBC5_9FLAO|nr:glycosyltransferase family 2 protein [Muriicola soli]QBA65036.1 glycosyltransferase family 2 protein [Muriicola soli]